MGFSQCLVFLFFVLTNFQLHAYARNRGDSTPFFVFGDSLVDNGNNNFLATTARADSAPYGIDYPGHRATGRFSNGLNIPDIISEYFGWESTLPYLSPDLKGEKLLVGANFASAGVGVLNDTGVQFMNIIKVYQQLSFFRQYQQRLSAVIGREQAARHVKSSLVLITLGGNDFVNNYYLVPYSMRSQQFTLEAYVPFVISEYKKILKKLYGLGARRVIVTGNGPLGCVPAELAMHSIDGECSDELQTAAALWNPQLVTMLSELNSEIGYNVFLAANTQQMHNDFLTNPKQFGFKTSKEACCGQGPFNGLGLCSSSSNLCKNRDEYVFWDAFHPSEKANRLIAQQILTGSLDYMHPMNLTTVMARNEFGV